MVRTRVAPSPTGDPHVGTAYMALFSYCFAKQHGGEFVLRIEDTDAARSTLASERKILDSLRWLGLEWDEGPDVGGPRGPYRQSERLEIYRSHVDQLLSQGNAFHCFCSAEDLDAMRKDQMAAGKTARYDGRCASLTDAEVSAKLEETESQLALRVAEYEVLRKATSKQAEEYQLMMEMQKVGFSDSHVFRYVLRSLPTQEVSLLICVSVWTQRD